MKFGGFFIALALVLAACSGDPQPREPDPTTAAPSATSTATPPAMPAQASEDSPEGAAAFVTYWVQVSNYAAATGDVTELSRISAPDCSGCQKYIDLYRDTYEAGGYINGNVWTTGDFDIDFGDPETYLATTVSISAGDSKQSADAKVVTDPRASVDLSFALQGVEGAWQMTQLALGGFE